MGSQSCHAPCLTCSQLSTKEEEEEEEGEEEEEANFISVCS